MNQTQSFRYLIGFFSYEKSAGRQCFLLDKSCRKCARLFTLRYVNRGKVTSWRVSGTPLAAPSIIKPEIAGINVNAFPISKTCLVNLIISILPCVSLVNSSLGSLARILRGTKWKWFDMLRFDRTSCANAKCGSKTPASIGESRHCQF
jgi:hypothetical protein